MYCDITHVIWPHRDLNDLLNYLQMWLGNDIYLPSTEGERGSISTVAIKFLTKLRRKHGAKVRHAGPPKEEIIKVTEAELLKSDLTEMGLSFQVNFNYGVMFDITDEGKISYL